MSWLTNDTPLHALPDTLRDSARRSLTSQEEVFHAISAESDSVLVRATWLFFAWMTQTFRPARALILTSARVLLLEEPGELVVVTADHASLVASCPITQLICLEARAHLLDCALTLVFVHVSHVERVTFAYSGVDRWRVLKAVASLRALQEGLPQNEFPLEDEESSRRSFNARWETLSGLSMAMKHAVIRYLVPSELVESWLFFPAMDERTWWQRLGIGANEYPPAVLVRTNRQLLIVQETKRMVQGGAAYGDDAWLVPFSRLASASVFADQLRLTLRHLGLVETLVLPVPPDQAEQVLMFMQSCLKCHSQGHSQDPGVRA